MSEVPRVLLSLITMEDRFQTDLKDTEHEALLDVTLVFQQHAFRLVQPNS